MNEAVVAFVHAKGTSDRVPGKNLRLLGDCPLFCHAIAAAREASLVDRVVIDSDCDEILRVGAAHGAVPLKRSPSLATNRTTGDDLACWQASSYPDSQIVLQVVPTSPFLKPESVDRAVALLREESVDSVVGVFSDVFYLWKDGRPAYFRPDGSIPNSFEIEPLVYETTGLYVNRTEFVLRHRKRVNPASCVLLGLSRLEAVDINTEEDFNFAEIVWKGIQSAKVLLPLSGTSR